MDKDKRQSKVLGEIIRDYFDDNQSEFSDATEISASQVNKLVKNTIGFSERNLIKICKMLDRDNAKRLIQAWYFDNLPKELHDMFNPSEFVKYNDKVDKKSLLEAVNYIKTELEVL